MRRLRRPVSPVDAERSVERDGRVVCHGVQVARGERSRRLATGDATRRCARRVACAHAVRVTDGAICRGVSGGARMHTAGRGVAAKNYIGNGERGEEEKQFLRCRSGAEMHRDDGMEAQRSAALSVRASS